VPRGRLENRLTRFRLLLDLRITVGEFPILWKYFDFPASLRSRGSVPAFSHRKNVISQKQNDCEGVEQTAPALKRRPRTEIAGDS